MGDREHTNHGVPWDLTIHGKNRAQEKFMIRNVSLQDSSMGLKPKTMSDEAPKAVISPPKSASPALSPQVSPDST